MTGPRFTPQAVLEIRAQHAARTLDVRAWAETYRVSLETIRRIARGDTYRELLPAGAVIPPSQPAHGPVIAPPREVADEPDAAALAASFARLAAAQAARPPDAQALLDELQGRTRPASAGGPALAPPDTPPGTPTRAEGLGGSGALLD